RNNKAKLEPEAVKDSFVLNLGATTFFNSFNFHYGTSISKGNNLFNFKKDISKYDVYQWESDTERYTKSKTTFDLSDNNNKTKDIVLNYNLGISFPYKKSQIIGSISTDLAVEKNNQGMDKIILLGGFSQTEKYFTGTYGLSYTKGFDKGNNYLNVDEEDKRKIRYNFEEIAVI